MRAAVCLQESVLRLRHGSAQPEATLAPPVVAAKKKGGAGKPVLAVEGDTLETTPMMVGLVAGSWVVSLMALQPLFAALAAGPSPLQLIQLAFTFVATVVFSDFFSGVFHWCVVPTLTPTPALRLRL